MPHPQDPRFEGKAKYDRDEVIAIVFEFYKYLAEMAFIEPRDFLFPPPGGWSNISREIFAALGKDDEVIKLIAHLP